MSGFESPRLGSAGSEVILQCQWPLGPSAQGGSPTSQGDIQATSHMAVPSKFHSSHGKAQVSLGLSAVPAPPGKNTLGAHLESAGLGANKPILPGEPPGSGGPTTACKSLP